MKKVKNKKVKKKKKKINRVSLVITVIFTILTWLLIFNLIKYCCPKYLQITYDLIIFLQII